MSETAPEEAILFGGSFNPPHLAHAGLVGHLIDRFAPPAEILIVPTYRHAFGKPLEAFDHRLEMLRLAFADFERWIRISDIESRLPFPNRTIDTIEAMNAERPGIRWSIAVGSDIQAEKAQWKDFDRLSRLVRFIDIPRAGWPTEEGDDPPNAFLPDISSTEIRRRLANGEAPNEALHPDVLAYITRHGLYGWPGAST